MAAVNSVQNSIRLPLAGLAPPRVLMCSASMGAEGSVTLQLREAVQAPDAAGTSLSDHGGLTIGYPDPEMLADMLGSFQSASAAGLEQQSSAAASATFDLIQDSSSSNCSSRLSGLDPVEQQQQQQQHQNIASALIAKASSPTGCNASSSCSGGSSGNKSNANGNLTLGGIKGETASKTDKLNGCIPTTVSHMTTGSASSSPSSSNCSISSNSSSSSSISASSSSNSKSATAALASAAAAVASAAAANSANNNNSTTVISSATLGGHSSRSDSTSSCSSNSSSSSSSSSSISSSNSSTGSNSCGSGSSTVAVTVNGLPTVVKKPRPKTASPTRHGPQQCQVCSKVFGNASALAKHKLTHSDERKYVCGMCSKAFKRQDHLNGHMLTHRNKKPYECKAEGCGKSYCDARSLRRHTENHHSAVGGGGLSGASTPTPHTTTPSPTAATAAALPPAMTMTMTTSTATTTAMTTGPLSGLSLSPATASGDASSPHGATCSIQFTSAPTTALSSNNNNNSSSNGTTMTSSNSSSKNLHNNISSGGHLSDNSAASSKSPSPSSPASGTGNEGLTRQQLDLITQIMQQTKQANAAAAAAGQKVHPRPRTWNMQLQLSQHKVSSVPAISCSVPTSQTSSSQSSSSSSSSSIISSTPSTQSTTTAETTTNSIAAAANSGQAQNKADQKPVECNLCHRKFKNIPALNGHMRLHGGYFKKDTETKKCDKKEHTGPPLQTASVGVRALIEEKIINKRSKDLKGSFVVPAAPLTARRLLEASEALFAPKSGTVAIVSTHNGTTQIMNPKATIMAASAAGSVLTTSNTAGCITATEVKDATLIELLKRGTKVAVKRTCSDPGQLAITTPSVATAATTRTVVLPANLNSVSSTPGSTPPLALSIANSLTTNGSSTVTANCDSTPLSLTISQAPSGSTDVFTLAYSTDATGAAAFFSDNDVYSVSDTTMLLQAVDSIQLLQDPSSNDQLDEIASLSDYTTINEQTFTTSRQLQAVLDSPLPESLAEFSALHSKDFILYGGNAGNTSDPTGSQASNSPLPSPLAYPTPPASHEAVAQASPFLDDSRHFSDASSFFDDKRTSSANFLDDGFFKTDSKDVKLSDEKILALKNELLDENHDLFRSNKNILDEHCHELFKSEDSFFVEESPSSKQPSSSSASVTTVEEVGSPSKINLDFLDEAQAFINESRNASSPLSNAFFSATMSSAEEVKEALEEVLPSDEDVVIAEADIDLYYLNGLTSLQSQMMPNSDDPLLSSSPKDFAHRQHQKFLFEQQQEMLAVPQQPPNSNHNNNNTFSPPSAKKLKTEADVPALAAASDTNKIPLTVQTEQIPKDNHNDSVFLSPSSISSTSSSGSSSSPKLQHALLRKRPTIMPTVSIRKSPIYHSKLRKSTSAVPVTHYTPQPMLNPGRTAPGLYSTIASSLANQSSSVSESTVDNTSDIFSEPPLPIRPRINLGNDYQATIPECTAANYHHLNHQPDQHMWDPMVFQNNGQIARFVELSRSSAVPLGCHTEETALKSLLEAQGEIHIAILNLMQTPPAGIHRRWSAGEMEQFIRGLELYGKDFFRIATELLPEKSTGDCVQLYYFWKKLCVDYKTTHLLQHGDNSMKFINMNVSPDDLLLDHAGYTSSPVRSGNGLGSQQTGNDVRPHVCEVPDCSASFSSKAALHGHIRIHCIGRSAVHLNGTTQNGNFLSTTAVGNPINPNHIPTKDDYPCKVCGKVFNKVKSRSAHMKSHRPQDASDQLQHQLQLHQQHMQQQQHQQQQQPQC
ncbi:serine-rich adhesin for platelets isoform X2 [Topomyia yanbarensis]|uniref:serine-rich adhesin for platelets isoform X2 n=1 Tax=Topomyia yanbarensis TaxID=2498891 RepID=UPI00273BCD6B|nr:serine-rich adhesin for platelets isoform X2 [Topomyia yanbarensis]